MVWLDWDKESSGIKTKHVLSQGHPGAEKRKREIDIIFPILFYNTLHNAT